MFTYKVDSALWEGCMFGWDGWWTVDWERMISREAPHADVIRIFFLILHWRIEVDKNTCKRIFPTVQRSPPFHYHAQKWSWENNATHRNHNSYENKDANFWTKVHGQTGRHKQCEGKIHTSPFSDPEWTLNIKITHFQCIRDRWRYESEESSIPI